jgi:serine phosphatase RsbU (regulator of sigma subunit)
MVLQAAATGEGRRCLGVCSRLSPRLLDRHTVRLSQRARSVSAFHVRFDSVLQLLRGRMVKRARVLSPTRRFWRSLPLQSLLLFLAAVFCLFSMLGFLSDFASMGRASMRTLVLDVLLSGLIAVAWALTGTTSSKFLILALPLLAISVSRKDRVLLSAAELENRPRSEVRERLEVDARGTVISIGLAYGCFILFVATEGKRYMRIQAEIALARDLHQVLAPPIDRRLDKFEFFGASIPSSEVGGDLVDVVAINGQWTAYIADVSGHGVASGTLMAMFKSAMRSQLMLKRDPQELLTDLSQVILDLKRSSMFITCAFLAYQADDTLQYALAGHLPILHYRQGEATVDELSVSHLPLGMFEQQRYRTAPVHFQPGDLFALVTDGLTEVFDTRDNEFGRERLKQVIATNGEKPLRDVFAAVIARVRQHGRQTDDQSLLLIRCL